MVHQVVASSCGSDDLSHQDRSAGRAVLFEVFEHRGERGAARLLGVSTSTNNTVQLRTQPAFRRRHNSQGSPWHSTSTLPRRGSAVVRSHERRIPSNFRSFGAHGRLFGITKLALSAQCEGGARTSLKLAVQAAASAANWIVRSAPGYTGHGADH